MADTFEQLNCPACGKSMKKVYITDEKIYLDVCTEGCGGILFDKGELKNVLITGNNLSLIKKLLSKKNDYIQLNLAYDTNKTTVNQFFCNTHTKNPSVCVVKGEHFSQRFSLNG